jgi:hypothetical protein
MKVLFTGDDKRTGPLAIPAESPTRSRASQRTYSLTANGLALFLPSRNALSGEPFQTTKKMSATRLHRTHRLKNETRPVLQRAFFYLCIDSILDLGAHPAEKGTRRTEQSSAEHQ